jgi:rubredoxin
MENPPETTWKCSKCGYTFTALKPDEECPSCHEKCEVIDLTCSTPDCGGPGQDNRL